jgi:hypothetical protein
MAEQVRFGWDDRTEAYRRRLERQGITRSMWEQGADLRAARGHKPAPLLAPGKAKALDRVIKAGSTDINKDYKTLQRGFRWPKWIPKDNPITGPTSIDVAVALSQLPAPSKWKSVDMVPRPDGQFWTMTVQLKGNAYPVVIDIPGGGGAGSGAKQVLEIVTNIGKMPSKKRNEAEEVFLEVMGSA